MHLSDPQMQLQLALLAHFGTTFWETMQRPIFWATLYEPGSIIDI